MRPVPLDPDTADRLLAGVVPPEDAPPGYEEVARLLSAASSEPTAEELAHEEELVAQMAAVVCSSLPSPRSRRRFKPVLRRRRVTAALVFAGLACSAGLASAGSLPGGLQDVASAALAKVGISVPDGDGEAATLTTEHRVTAVTGSRALKGREVPATAKRAGALRRSAVSAASRDVKSRAEQRRTAAVRQSKSARAGGTTRNDHVPGTPSSAAVKASKSRGPERRSARAASVSRRQAAHPGRGQGAPGTPRKRRTRAGAQSTRNSTPNGSGAGQGHATGRQQDPAKRNDGQGGSGAGTPGGGGSGNPGTGGQGGEPANGSAGPSGTAVGNAGRNGRP